MNSTVLQSLVRLGLTDTEAAVYVAGLEFPTVNATVLSKLTSIKRPTVYHALMTLEAKGLVSKKVAGHTTVFMMTPPAQFTHLINEQIASLESQKNTVEELRAALPIATKNPAATEIAHFEGIEGIKTVVEEALYAKTRQWSIIAPHINFFREFDTEYAKYFMETRKARGVVARTLWEGPLPGGRPLSKEEIVWRNPRYLPQVMRGQFKATIILFDNRVAIISSLSERSAILLTSTEIHGMVHAMFEGLWSTSIPYITS